jgi:nucleoid DNA-binding protein
MPMRRPSETANGNSGTIIINDITAIHHLAEDGYCLKLNGLGKFMVHHQPSIRRKIGFSGETRDLPVRRKVKFTGLGKLRQLERVKH